MPAYEKREALHDDSPPPDVQRYRCDKVRFHTASPVLQPSSMLVLQEVLRYQIAHADHKLLITAHTDTVGSSESNQTLSEKRALSVLYVLANDQKAWAELAAADHRPGDVDAFLKEIARKYRHMNCHPDKVSNPIQAFKETYNQRSTTFTDTANAADVPFWERVFAYYQGRLRKYLGGYAKWKQAIEALNWVDAEHRAIGCGERHLFVPTKQNTPEVENRRIEFLFFPPGTEPDPDTGSEGDVEGHPAYLEDAHDPKHYHLVDMECPDIIYQGRPVPSGNVLFVIDFSGSMDGVRLDRALDELVDAISMLDERYHFGVLFFGSHMQSLWWTGGTVTRTNRATNEEVEFPAFFVAGEEAKVKLRTASPENIEAALARLEQIPLLGGTRTYEAFQLALDPVGLRELEAGDRNTLEFLSDGDPNPLFVTADGRTRAEDGRWFTSRYTAEPVTQRTSAGERQAISEYISANNPQGFVINATGFYPKWRTSAEADKPAEERTKYDATTLRTWMESLTTLGPREGSFLDRYYGYAFNG